jgi:hypothetical protein
MKLKKSPKVNKIVTKGFSTAFGGKLPLLARITNLPRFAWC